MHANTQSFQRLVSKRKVNGEEIAESVKINTNEEIVVTQDVNSPYAGPQFIPETADVEVYADVVTVSGPLLLPSRNVHIYCRVLKAEADSEKRPAAIHVDGEDGDSGDELKSLKAPDGKDATKPGQSGTGAKQLEQMHGRSGNAGTPGDDGGHITIVCQSVDAGAQLLLTAVGGDGGNGSDGQSGGKGGNGKNGYDANIDIKRDIFVIANQVQGAQKGGDGGDGGDAGGGGGAGREGRGGRVFLCVLDGPHRNYNLQFPAGGMQSHGRFTDWRGRKGRLSGRAPAFTATRDGQPSMNITVWTHEGMAGTPGKAGEPGAVGNAGKGGKGKTFKGVIDDVKKDDAPDGTDGVAGNKARDGNLWGYGRDGEVEQGPRELGGGAWKYYLGDAPDTLAELKQVSQTYLKMEYEKACVQFLAAGNRERSDELDQRNDELDASWKTLVWLEQLLPSPDSEGVPDFTRSLAKSVQSLKDLHQFGCNYFGESVRHVPRRSLKQITGDLKERLELFGKIETAHNNILSSMDASNLADSELQIDLSQIGSFRRNLKRSSAHTSGRLKTLEEEISAATDEVGATRERLDAGLASFREAIKMSAGVSVEDALDSLEQMVFTMSSASEGLMMAGVQGMKLYNKSRNYVINDYGDSVKKEYVLNRVQSFGEDLDGTAGGWAFAADGSVDDAEAGVRAILVSEGEFIQLAEAFLDSVPEADIARDLFKDHEKMVRERGRLLVEYNAAIGALVNIDNDIQQADLLAHATQTGLANNLEPDLPVRLFLSTKMYERAKKGCIEEIYRASRAQTYENLEPCDLFGELLGGRHPNDITKAILDGAYNLLTGAMNTAIENRGLERSPFPAGGAKAAGLWIELTPETDARFFDTLRKKGHASIRIHPPGKSSVRENRFAGRSDVRVEIARAWIVVDRETGPGGDTMIAVLVSQLGKETIVSRTGEKFRFEHEPVKVKFRYDIAQKVPSYDAITKASNSGQDAIFHTFDPKEGGYATLSPFSRWRIELPRKENTCITREDLKSATKVILEFHGRSLAA